MLKITVIILLMASSATHGEVQQNETKKVCSVIGMCKVHIKIEPELYTLFPFFKPYYWKVSKFHVLILTIFWKNGGNYSRGDIIQGRMLIKDTW